MEILAPLRVKCVFGYQEGLRILVPSIATYHGRPAGGNHGV